MESGTSTVVSMLTSQATNLATELTSLVNSMGPIIVGVVATVLILTAGIRLFKKLAGKAN